MRKLLIVALAAAPLAMAFPAFASDDDARCPVVPEGEWLSLGEIEAKLQGMGYLKLSLGEIEAKLQGMGYQVREIERERNCYEFEGIDANGAKVEGYLNPRTGDFVQRRDQDRERDRRRDDDSRGNQGQGNRG